MEATWAAIGTGRSLRPCRSGRSIRADTREPRFNSIGQTLGTAGREPWFRPGARIAEAPDMTRMIAPRIVGASSALPERKDGIGEYLERIAKLVPVEIIAAYMAVRGFVPESGELSRIPPWVEIAAYAVFVLLTPAYLGRFAGPMVRGGLQLVLATISFVVWSYAIGGPFFWSALERVTGAEIINSDVAGIVAIIWSLCLVVLAPKRPAVPRAAG
jgi:hypothetical protein